MIFLSISHISYAQTEEIFDFEDNEGDGWFNCGDGASWHLDSAEHCNGKQSMTSGDIECTGVRRLCRNIQGPASVEFCWKNAPVPGEGNQLAFLVDGRVERTFKSSYWKKEPPVYLNENKLYTVSWTLTKSSCPPGSGLAWIDDVTIKYKVPPITNNQTVYVKSIANPDDFVFDSISEAIKHVVPGGTVIVARGSYSGPIEIGIPLKLIGENKEETIIYSDSVDTISVHANDVTIRGFTIRGSSCGNCHGIRLSGSDIIIADNNLISLQDAIVAKNCYNVSIRNNRLSDVSRVGVYLIDTNLCNVHYNNIIGTEHGICLWNTASINIEGNEIHNSRYGISLRSGSHDNIIGEENKFDNVYDCHISDTSSANNLLPPTCRGDTCKKC